MLNVSSNSSSKEQLEQLCSTTIDNSQDFTDSIYISIEQRDKVLEYHRKLQDQLAEIIKLTSNGPEVRIHLLNYFILKFDFVFFQKSNELLPIAIQSIQKVARDFRQQVN